MKTRSEFAEAHKKLWNAIRKKISSIKRGHFVNVGELKHECFDSLFPYLRKDHCSCFGCEWKAQHRKCLFATKKSCGSDYNIEKCLDGLYNRLEICLEECPDSDLSLKKAIVLAKKIRDFPVRKN